MGQVVGDGAAVVQGTVETGVGAGGEIAGVGLDATGAGAVVGVPLNIVSAGVVVHGTVTGTTAAGNLGHAVINAFSGKRQGEFKSGTREERFKIMLTRMAG